MNDPPEHVTARMAARVRAARMGRSWTLDELASRSSVSRRLLVQIEQAQANPRLATLLKLAAALRVTLTDLLERDRDSPPLGIVAGDDVPELWSTPAGGAGRLLVSQGPLELWSWTLQPGDRRDSEAHRPGSLELLNVTSGSVCLQVGDHHADITAGDSAWFDGAHPHAFSNSTRACATFTVVVLEPRHDHAAVQASRRDL